MFSRIRNGLRAARQMRAAAASGMGGVGMTQAQREAVVAASNRMRASIDAGERPDGAAYMATLAANGMVMQRSLPATDPRLAPVDGLAFDAYVELVAGEITDPDGTDTEVPGFRAWSDRVVADKELGVHYTAVLQEKIARRQGA